MLNNGVSPSGDFGVFLGEFSGEEDELFLPPPFSFLSSLPILSDFYRILFVSQVVACRNLTHARQVQRKQGQKWSCQWFLFLSILNNFAHCFFVYTTQDFLGYNLGLP